MKFNIPSRVIMILVFIITIYYAGKTFNENFLVHSLDFMYSYLPYFILGLFLFSLNILNISAKYFFIYKRFGARVNFSKALKSFITGQMAGLLFFPFISSFLGQTSYLSKENKKVNLNVGIYLVERVITISVGLVFCFFAVIFLMPDQIEKFFQANSRLPFLIFVLSIALVMNLKRFTTVSTIISNIRKYGFIFIVVSFISSVSWVLMGVIYTLFIKFFNTQIPFIEALSASFIISFLSSLPLSPNGWGLREFICYNVLAIFGLGLKESITVGVSVGAITTLAVIFSFWMLKIFKGFKNKI